MFLFFSARGDLIWKSLMAWANWVIIPRTCSSTKWPSKLVFLDVLPWADFRGTRAARSSSARWNCFHISARRMYLQKLEVPTRDSDSLPLPFSESPRPFNKSQAIRIGSVLTNTASARPLKAVSTSVKADIAIPSGFDDGWLNRKARMAARLLFSEHMSKGDLTSL